MKICMDCGAPLQDKESFCWKCGALNKKKEKSTKVEEIKVTSH